MNRRTFLASASGKTRAPGDSVNAKGTRAVSTFANKVLPRVTRTTAGLEPYSGPWGPDQVAHLLRRTMFGVSKNHLDTLLQGTLESAILTLFSPPPAPSPPLNTNASDPDVAVGQTWINAPTNSANGPRNTSLKSWWISLMLNQPLAIQEKMVLFWHNHFVSASATVSDARLAYKQNQLLRDNALGNFKNLVKLITIDPAMLKYLNGNTNTKTNPNENYARELQELFTIGKGPEIGPGNYTNYTEVDVIAAAKVLTGWRVNATTLQPYFTLSRHDVTNKQFSSAYGNTVIVGSTDPAGTTEINALVEMIFAQTETARFICRKLYRWFVYYLIDEATEDNIIIPLANILRSNNYEVLPVLSALLSSAHFFDPINIGCQIKNPIDFTVGLCRMFPIAFPNATNLVGQYNHWKFVRTQAANMQMDVCDPPNVAGWPAYYQLPEYYELWINSDTLQKRTLYGEIIATTGHSQNGFTLVADLIPFVQQFPNPGSPDALVDALTRLLFPIPLTENQKAFLKGILIPGLPDYEWTNEWNAYLSDPSNSDRVDAITSKLKALLSFMVCMPEYQLA